MGKDKNELLKIAYQCKNIPCIRISAIVELHEGEEPMNEEYWVCPNCGEEYKKWYYDTRAEFAKEIECILNNM